MSLEQPERVDLKSMSVSADRIAKLREDFPEVFREDKVDFDALKRSLGEWVDPGKERFGLQWPGKAECIKVIQQASVGTLLPQREESVDFDMTQNLIIEGDNLEVLKLLQKSYYGKVKMIYIDPPYNTGNEFIYPDNFKEGLQEYLKYSGQVDSEGVKTSTNTESDGRYHSKWLNMMYPRLYLARNLLRDDGAIFVSIDDHEVNNLRALMNEVFGEENFIASIIWQKVYAPKSTAKHFSEDHDYIIVFAKISEKWAPGLLPRTEEQDSHYGNPDNDPRGVWRADGMSARNFYSKGTYSIVSPGGRPISGPPSGRYWVYSKEKFEQLNGDNRIWWGDEGNNMPAVKRFLTEVRQGRVPQTLWEYENAGHTQEAKKELLERVSFNSSDSVFDTPKPTRLIQQMLRVGTSKNERDIVLDFFAGSGSTGDAVMQLNTEDGGNREFILVQLPEKTGSMDFSTIAALTRARCVSAAKSIGKRLEGKLELTPRLFSTLGFRAYRLLNSNFKPWDGNSLESNTISEQLNVFTENIIANRSEEDILTEILLKSGYELTTPIERLFLAEKSVFSISNGALLVCLDRELTLEAVEAMVDRNPAQIVVLDAGFKNNDPLKVNVVQTIKARARSDESTIAFKVV